MRFRQIHLDFHTHERIPGIGSGFDAAEFQAALTQAHVNSVTLFAKCHHGWSYHPTDVGRMHPELSFDLLGAQIEACAAIGVATPIYITAGLDEQSYWAHPEWARRLPNGEVPWAHTNDNPGYHELCLNTEYADHLIATIEEVARSYPTTGIFLDILSARPCWCNHCVQERIANGDDPRDEQAIAKQAHTTFVRYLKRVRDTLDAINPDLQVFHNGGHVRAGVRSITDLNSHLELESLPTGGWGYDHFPLSAAYARTLGKPFLGMSGKFHTSWGEFGGYKHPIALRYEALAAGAHGGAFSIGDQLHPDGRLDPTTYSIVSEAYAALEAAEPWLIGATSLAQVAVFTAEAAVNADPHLMDEAGTEQVGRHSQADVGVCRLLAEGKLFYDVVDIDADWDHYRLIILPDVITIHPVLHDKIAAFVAKGGRILATGASGLDRSGAMCLDLGCSVDGMHPHNPDYIVPSMDLPPWGRPAFVVYGQAHAITTVTGATLAQRDPPYFNRDLLHYCSHKHTPNSRHPDAPVATSGPHGGYIAYPVFDIYAAKGQQILRDFVLSVIRSELGGSFPVETTLPAAGRLTHMHQAAEQRDVLHLLFATPSKRGDGIEVLEDCVPVFDIQVQIQRPTAPHTITLAPCGTPIDFHHEDGVTRFTIPHVHVHQMVVLQNADSRNG